MLILVDMYSHDHKVSDRLQSLLQELKSQLQALYADRLFSVLLYGSVARGEANADSDFVKTGKISNDLAKSLASAYDDRGKLYQIKKWRSHFFI